MNHRPDDRLSAVELSQSPRREPELYGLDRIGPFLKMSRRDLFRVAMAAVAAGGSGVFGATGTPVGYAHNGVIYGLRFSADGTLLVSGSKDKTLKYWKPPLGAHYKTLTESDEVLELSVSPDASKAAMVLGQGFAVQSLSSGDIVKKWSGQ